jgi:alpha-tubulin suppressor-like RCC1 family protein
MGQLGVGTNDSGFGTPMTAAAANVASMTAGGQIACAVKNNHTLWCWGDDNNGQLGIGSSGDTVSAPNQAGTDTDWKTVETGVQHTCAIKTGGTRWCWGNTANNGLGDDGALSGNQTTPVQTDLTNSDWSDLSCSQGFNGGFCIGLRGTTVWSWGDNGFEQAGFDVNTTPVVSPMATPTFP